MTTITALPITVREHKVETYKRIAFDEPILAENAYGPTYEITSATVTSAIWLADDMDGPSDEPYITTTFFGYPLTAKGQRDKRNPRPVMVSSSYVSDEVIAAVKAMA